MKLVQKLCALLKTVEINTRISSFIEGRERLQVLRELPYSATFRMQIPLKPLTSHPFQSSTA